MAQVNEIPGGGSLKAEYVDAFNKLAREACKVFDQRYAYFSDLIYDAHYVLREYMSMDRPESVALLWYVRDCGTVIAPYYDAQIAGLNPHVSRTHKAAYLIEVERMEYGSFNMTVREYAGPFAQ